jgi:hypothetical protein
MTTSEPSATPARPRRTRAVPTATPGSPETPAAGTAAPAEPAAPPPTAPASDAPATAGTQAAAGEPRVVTLRLPLVTAIVRVPRLPSLPALPGARSLPHVGRREMAEAAQTVRAFLPPPRKMLFYGGLGALAAFEIIEWPIAAVVAAATVVVDGHHDRERDRVFVPAHQEDGAAVPA